MNEPSSEAWPAIAFFGCIALIGISFAVTGYLERQAETPIAVACVQSGGEWINRQCVRKK